MKLSINYEHEKKTLATLMEEHPQEAAAFSEELFWFPEHKIFLKGLQAMSLQGIANDYYLMEMVLSPGDYEKLGGIKGVMRFSECFQSGTDLEWMKRLLVDLAERRRFQLGWTDALEHFDEKPFRTLREEQKKLLESANDDIVKLEDFHDVVGTFLSDLDKRIEYYQRTGLEYKHCIPTGMRVIDDIAELLLPGEMTIIAGRPGCGKTSFLLSLAYRLIEFEEAKTAVVCFEMSTDALQRIVASIASRIPMNRLRTGTVRNDEREKLEKALGLIQRGALSLRGGGSTQLEDVIQTIENAAKEGFRVVMIDYIGLINSGARKWETRQTEVQYISKALREAANRLNIGLVVACQLSRRSEERVHPEMADLKESGQIEQDASVVGLLYKEDGFSSGITLYLAKNRAGPNYKIGLPFARECGMVG